MYHQPHRVAGRRIAIEVLDSFLTCPIPQIARLLCGYRGGYRGVRHHDCACVEVPELRFGRLPRRARCAGKALGARSCRRTLRPLAYALLLPTCALSRCSRPCSPQKRGANVS